MNKIHCMKLWNCQRIKHNARSQSSFIGKFYLSPSLVCSQTCLSGSSHSHTTAAVVHLPLGLSPTQDALYKHLLWCGSEMSSSGCCRRLWNLHKVGPSWRKRVTGVYAGHVSHSLLCFPVHSDVIASAICSRHHGLSCCGVLYFN